MSKKGRALLGLGLDAVGFMLAFQPVGRDNPWVIWMVSAVASLFFVAALWDVVASQTPLFTASRRIGLIVLIFVASFWVTTRILLASRKDLIEQRVHDYRAAQFVVQWKLALPYDVPTSIRQSRDATEFLNRVLCHGPAGFELIIVLIPRRSTFEPDRLWLDVIGRGAGENCSCTATLAGADADGMMRKATVPLGDVEVADRAVVFRTLIFRTDFLVANWNFPEYRLSEFGEPIATEPYFDSELSYGLLQYNLNSVVDANGLADKVPVRLGVTIWPNPRDIEFPEDVKATWDLRAAPESGMVSLGGPQLRLEFRLFRDPPAEPEKRPRQR